MGKAAVNVDHEILTTHMEAQKEKNPKDKKERNKAECLENCGPILKEVTHV